MKLTLLWGLKQGISQVSICSIVECDEEKNETGKELGNIGVEG